MVQEERRFAAESSRAQGQRPLDDWAYAPGEAPPPGEIPSTTPAARPANKAGRAVREIVETLLLALVIFLAVRLVVLNFRVDGDSMAPNLTDQQMLLVNRNAYANVDLNRLLNLLPGEDRDGEWIFYPFDPPDRGDIVVFDPPVRSDKPYIKRVIGLPGEEITFKDGYVYVNGHRLTESYLDGTNSDCGRGRNCDLTLGEDQVYVMGDNRDNSSDSRSFGPIAVDDIVGKAWFSYWPAGDIGLVPHNNYPDLPAGPAVGDQVPDGVAAASPHASESEEDSQRTDRARRTPRPDRVPRVERTVEPE